MLTVPQQLWVDALRSGKYEQGRRSLHSDRGFCCLGVACDLYVKHVDPVYPKTYLGSVQEYAYGPKCRTGLLPEAVQRWLGLSSPSGLLLHDEARSLVSFNDTGTPFLEIADFIESHAEELFEPATGE